MEIQHRFWDGERVEVCQHRQHGRPPEKVQVQHDRPPRGSDPSAVHVLHQRAHKRGEVFTLCSQASRVGPEKAQSDVWTYWRPQEYFHEKFTHMRISKRIPPFGM